jgi:dolichol-phosphate mannosyltransferase
MPPHNYDVLVRDLSIVIPTLNEEATIGVLISELLSLSDLLNIIVVDDRSTDRTQDVVETFISKFPRQVHLISREVQLNGLGGAYIEGYKLAASLGSNWIIQMDADGQHAPSDLNCIWDARRPETIVVGSRYCKNGSVEGWSKFRLLISKLHKTDVKDCTGGFKLIPNRIAQELWVKPPSTKGFTFHAETTARAISRKIIITEVPITFCVRSAGNSKMSFSSGLESFFAILKWKLKV